MMFRPFVGMHRESEGMSDEQMSEIVGAVARGWCSKGNEKKEMDPTLAEAIANEVSVLLSKKLKDKSKTIQSYIDKVVELEKQIKEWEDKKKKK